jgi:hypothetical protein
MPAKTNEMIPPGVSTDNMASPMILDATEVQEIPIPTEPIPLEQGPQTILTPPDRKTTPPAKKQPVEDVQQTSGMVGQAQVLPADGTSIGSGAANAQLSDESSSDELPFTFK